MSTKLIPQAELEKALKTPGSLEQKKLLAKYEGVAIINAILEHLSQQLAILESQNIADTNEKKENVLPFIAQQIRSEMEGLATKATTTTADVNDLLANYAFEVAKLSELFITYTRLEQQIIATHEEAEKLVSDWQGATQEVRQQLDEALNDEPVISPHLDTLAGISDIEPPVADSNTAQIWSHFERTHGAERGLHQDIMSDLRLRLAHVLNHLEISEEQVRNNNHPIANRLINTILANPVRWIEGRTTILCRLEELSAKQNENINAMQQTLVAFNDASNRVQNAYRQLQQVDPSFTYQSQFDTQTFAMNDVPVHYGLGHPIKLIKFGPQFSTANPVADPDSWLERNSHRGDTGLPKLNPFGR